MVQVSVELIVEASAGTKMIGKGGCVIRELEEATGARIKVNRDGSNVASGEKMVVVMGEEDRIRRALETVIRKLVDCGATSDEVFLNIPPNATQNIVGSGGSTVRRLQDETGAHINIPRKGSSDSGRVHITGSKPKEIADCCASIQTIVDQTGSFSGRDSGFKGELRRNFSPPPRREERRDTFSRGGGDRDGDRGGRGGGGGDRTPIQFLLGSSLARSLVGRGGSTVQAIERKTGSAINVSKDQTDDNRFASITGGDRIEALKECLHRLEDTINEPISSVHFQVPPESCRLIIGTKGATVNRVQQESGAKIDIAKDGTPGTVSVSGTIHEIVRAANSIYNIVDDKPSSGGGGSGRDFRDDHRPVRRERTPPRRDYRESRRERTPPRRMPSPPRKRAALDASGDTLEMVIRSGVAPRLVGPKGAVINEIISMSGARVNVDKEGARSRNVTVVGELGARAKALQQIISIIDQAEGGLKEMEMICPLRRITSVVGSKGSTVQKVETESGCRVHIARKDGNDPPGQIRLKGEKDSIFSAMCMIDELINSTDQDQPGYEDRDQSRDYGVRESKIMAD